MTVKIEVFDHALVACSPSSNKVYSPGVHVAPRAHVEQIEAQGKGRRLEPAEANRPAARAPKSIDVEIKRDGSVVETIDAP